MEMGNDGACEECGAYGGGATLCAFCQKARLGLTPEQKQNRLQSLKRALFTLQEMYEDELIGERENVSRVLTPLQAAYGHFIWRVEKALKE